MRLSSGASPAVLVVTFGSPGTRDSDSKKRLGGSMQETQVQMHIHLPGVSATQALGMQTEGSFPRSISQTQEKAAQATPRSPAFKKAWGWGCRRNLGTGIEWVAGLCHLTGCQISQGLNRAWTVPTEIFGYFVHQGCDWLTLDGVQLATGVTGHF